MSKYRTLIWFSSKKYPDIEEKQSNKLATHLPQENQKMAKMLPSSKILMLLSFKPRRTYPRGSHKHIYVIPRFNEAINWYLKIFAVKRVRWMRLTSSSQSPSSINHLNLMQSIIYSRPEKNDKQISDLILWIYRYQLNQISKSILKEFH